MEFDHYKEGEFVTEPVSCSDGSYLRIFWRTFNPTFVEGGETQGIVFQRGLEPMGDLVSSWYSLENITLLGRGDLNKGINTAGQVWCQTSLRDLRKVGPLDDEIDRLRGRG